MRKLYDSILESISTSLTSDFDHYRLTLLTFLIKFSIVATAISFIVYPLYNEPTSIQLLRLGGFFSNFILYPLRQRHYQAVAMVFLYLQVYFVIFMSFLLIDRLSAIPYLLLVPVVSLHLFTFRQAIITSIAHIGILISLPYVANIPFAEELRTNIGLAVIFVFLTISTIIVRDKTIKLIQYQAKQLVKYETQKQEQILREKRSQYIREISKYISHDIRTPLSSINASQYLLQRLQTDHSSKKYLTAIAESVSHISNIVDDINQLLMVEEGEHFEFERIDLAQFVSRSVDTLRRSLIEERIFNVTFSEDNHHIWGDRQLLNLLTTKLVHNAVIYSGDDSVIHVDVSSSHEGTTLQISDDGIGIAEHEVSSIFDPFYKCDKARPLNGGYSGLGLTIAKKLVEFHGGTIRVETELGVGSTFIVQFPPLPTKVDEYAPVSPQKEYDMQSMLLVS